MLIALIIVHSCKKDKIGQVTKEAPVNPVISSAKKWYDSVYSNAKTTSGKQITASVPRLSQLVEKVLSGMGESKHFRSKWNNVYRITRN